MGVKKNFGYNLILTFCNYLFPLITYPYISRVLGVDMIGTCNFVDGIINYYILFSMLGIGSYGVREIARCKDDVKQRNEIFSNLVSLNLLFVILGVTILILSIYSIPKLFAYKQFLWIGLIKLVFNTFVIEWFFQGLQQFKYITIRSVLVRFVYVVCIFLFIHNESDAIIYYLLSSFIIVINAIINWNYSRKFVTFYWRNINWRCVIYPVIVFGTYRILTSMYTSFNVVFLGFTSGTVEVGFYTTATKLYAIIMGVFSAFTTTMIPKVSVMIKDGQILELQRLANNIFTTLFSIAIPIIVISELYAGTIIELLSGSGFEGAIFPFRIVIFLLIIIGMEQIIIQQYLMASTFSKPILAVSVTGAVVGVALNLLITSHLAAIGSAISWFLSEFAVLCVGIFLLKKYLNIRVVISNVKMKLFSLIIYMGGGLLLTIVHIPDIYSLALYTVYVMLCFIIIQYYLEKNSFLISVFQKIRLQILSKQNG